MHSFLKFKENDINMRHLAQEDQSLTSKSSENSPEEEDNENETDFQ
jgi:hypothetical protein